ncbi:MAG: SMP-30/gluconolactonase/LRE family protein [Acidobacteriota bacterium]|nr:SMP-30/gluconolactonase/LRE family protein [Acidobacteriota bacterium]
MKTIFVKCLGLILLSVATEFAQEKSRIAFKISEPDLIPEGIAYDARTKTFYVGSTYLRKIISIDQKGAVKNFTAESQDGMRGVLGMRVDSKRRVLWAISSDAGLSMPIKGNPRDCIGCSEVFKYALDTGKLIKKFVLKNARDKHFLNDLAVASNGDVYVTDTIHGAVYFISEKSDEPTELIRLEKTSYPNGIDLSVDEKHLFVGLEGKIAAIDLRNKNVVYLPTPRDVQVGGIDGLYFHKNSLIAVQPFDEGKTIVRYHLNEKRDRIEKAEIVEASHKLFDQPTTGIVVGKDFYYFANSQLQTFRKMFQPDGSFDKSQLSSIYVLKVRI